MVDPRPRASRLGILGPTVGAVFIYSNFETMLAPALPQLQQGLHIETAQLGWAFTAVLISGCATAPLVGRLGDLYDKSAILIGVLGMITVGLILAGSAHGLALFVTGQLLQGVGLGLVPLAVAVSADQFADAASKGNSIVIMAATISTALGFVLAAPILALGSFRWLYWVSLGPLLAMIVWLAYVRSPTPVRAAKARLDLAGAALLASALGAVLTGVTLAMRARGENWLAAGLFLVGGLLLIVFVVHELRTAAPLVDLRLLERRPVRGACLAAFCLGYGSFAAYVTVPLIGGAGPLASGISLLPMGLGGAVSAPCVGWLRRRFGARFVGVSALMLVVAGLAALGLFHARLIEVIGAMTLTGLGIGLGLTEFMNTLVEAVQAERIASSGGLAFVLKTIGGALGAQITAALLGLGSPVLALAVGAMVTLLAIPACFGLPAKVSTSLSQATPRSESLHV